jgi:hypothetical protein
MKAAKPAPDLALMLAQHLRSLAIGRKRYNMSDVAMEVLLKQLTPGEVVTLKNGRKYQLVDRYATKTTVFQPCGARRFQFDEVTEP